ncbi:MULTISPECIES: sulfite exporter TauE/SafE family protein [unclassified Pseudomonas]|uniref:sulfite exporter TauE/SafE family protein n=1 Tax=unclassified Pseudomonas TaxID=196821 RepID=UPI00245505AA|nr:MULTISPECIES: sulfite exporter TauE/SafE family protein [unclassified Pseudomonas]MDH4563269.1 sulfite exporter TauE/SafE family protein [Pseudomonas sp. BN411]MDH4874764.1 sulfite exporter TauE/SafE family protein [Pseudomonas sp. BN515]
MKIRDLDLSQSSINTEHEALGIPPVEDFVSHPDDHPVLRAAMWAAILILVGLLSFLAWRLFFDNGGNSGLEIIENALTSKGFWSAVAVGFFAQVIDGALGMAYGITATTFLLTTGASPAAASASVHIAEVFTTGLSGISHVKLGNVNKSLFLRLLLPGIIGAVLGAVLITQFDGAALKPFISAYLLLMGLYILSKAYRHIAKRKAPKHVAKLALFGGFVDAAGGGGWGPVVTSSLIGSGTDPRTTIGSVNFAEFFLTISSATSFILLAGAPDTWKMVAGLVFGGLFAAPLAALLCKKLSPRTLLIIVGCLITLISAFNIYKSLA